MSVTRQRRMHEGALGGLLGLSMAAGLVACQPAARGGGTATPGGNGAITEGPDPQGREEGDNIGDLKLRLERLRRQHAEMSSSSSGSASFAECEDLCSLGANLCSVTEKVCDIADDHPGEDEYQDLCRKAELECGEAEDSCVTCVEARERAEPQPAPAEPTS